MRWAKILILLCGISVVTGCAALSFENDQMGGQAGCRSEGRPCVTDTALEASETSTIAKPTLDRLADLKEEHRQPKLEMATMQNERDWLNRQVMALEQEVSMLRTDLYASEEEAARLTGTLAGRDAVMAQMEIDQAALAEVEAERDRLADQLVKQEGGLAKALVQQARLEALRRSTEAQKVEVEQALAQRSLALAELEDHYALLAGVEEEREHLANSLVERDKAMTEAQARQGRLLEAHLTLEKDRAILETSLADQDRELADVRKELEKVRDEQKALFAADSDRAQALQELAFNKEALAKETALREQVEAKLRAIEPVNEELGPRLATKSREMVDVKRDLYDLLLPQIRGGEIFIQHKGDQLTVRLTERLLFASGDDQLTPEGAAVLQSVGGILKDAGMDGVFVQGHTDNLPISSRLRARFRSNMDLSLARAETGARLLAAGGLEASRISIEGYADRHPVSSNAREEGRQKNRRIEIVVFKRAES